MGLFDRVEGKLERAYNGIFARARWAGDHHKNRRRCEIGSQWIGILR